MFILKTTSKFGHGDVRFVFDLRNQEVPIGRQLSPTAVVLVWQALSCRFGLGVAAV
jgi:hypothetical protein